MGGVYPIKMKNTAKVVTSEAKIFYLRLKDMFPNVIGDILKFIVSARVVYPQQKWINLDETKLEKARDIAIRSESEVEMEGFNPIRP